MSRYHRRRRSAALAAALAAAALGGPPALAQPPPARQGLEADVARLQQEVRDLRQMLIQAMQVEQQHHELLLKLMQSGGGVAPLPPGAAAAAKPGLDARAAVDPRAATARTGAVSGTVELRGAPAGQAAYVFVENLRATGAGRTLEIAQKGKQFSPQVSAVPAGTKVVFPNQDPVFHNVFSLARGNAFDVSLKSGERGNPVILARPGVVEVYCDIHEKMWAEILVAPSGYIVKVDPDGKFRLPNVPVGERVVTAWTAGARPVKRTVQVGGAHAEAEFVIQVPARKSHNNKLGQPYGNYGD
jgi:plastocyanin